MERVVQYCTIGRLSLKNYFSCLGWTGLGDPLPLIKRYERNDLKMMEPGRGVIESCLRGGAWVVIRRSRKLL